MGGRQWLMALQELSQRVKGTAYPRASKKVQRILTKLDEPQTYRVIGSMNSLGVGM